MSIADLLFILVVLASAGTLLVAAFRPRRAARILFVWIVCAGIYAAIAGLAFRLRPVLVLKMGDEQCSDDWCLTVQNARRRDDQTVVNIRFFSRARRVSQSEKSVIVYLTGDQGRRYDPVSFSIPLDARLAPGKSMSTAVTFDATARQLDLHVSPQQLGAARMADPFA